MTFRDRLEAALGAGRVMLDRPLGTLTTFKVGGPADWFAEPKSSVEMVAALRVAAREGIPVTILGGGSNVLISDRGIRGLVLRPRGGEVVRLDESRVSADAAVTINGLVRWTIMRSVAGLEAWAGTPGTVGGAVHGNAHFGGRPIGELVSSVTLATREGRTAEVPAEQMGFGYDRSRLQNSREVLLSAVFRVSSGIPATLREVARESLAFRKRTQPLDTPSAGCIFQNPVPGRDAMPDGMPWSAGALVDRAGLKDVRVGGARVSPAHGNFIVNDGHATAEDIRRLVEHCRAVVREQFGVRLREEIVYLGEFDVHTGD